ncbi:chemotaxis response regulator CheY [Venenivibrio stagnispumantis]|uniref:Two-component system, chemotaxis family, response regulator CheY n=1 Tax=Venenivibrio stagnispumantis TaxID=407998 RepID=A0AA45WNM9_9AQUI|nr:chemotaxis response regulator CheY [Venenivibrio stagnispumantis]MCW4573909.1 chemotaxis response regulator CheY [Venenivibrio stagnispumantis]SMP18707.1 two-component system, chemotaxis family, response regulator CheY [Venenivibrio stagnispumantis]
MGFPTDIKILTVDDMATMRRIIKSILNQLGYNNVDEAENGKDALSKLKQNKYDLVLLDWNMPEMDGITLLKEIRNDPQLKDIPVIMVTAEAKKENVLLAIQSGANNYIVKPFTAETLKEKLDKVYESLNK